MAGTGNFLLFFGVTFYPEGGWHDFAERSFASIELAQGHLSDIEAKPDWWHIVDLSKRCIVSDQDGLVDSNSNGITT